MSQAATIEERFKKPLYLVAKCMQMAEIPLLIMRAADHVQFVDSASCLMGGTVVYTSQEDFIDQALASFSKDDYLFAIVDQPLGGQSHRLVHGYLLARDITDPDSSQLEHYFGADAPNEKHRLILVVDQTVFKNHEAVTKRQMQELCTVIADS
jgi:hypothetical protein